MAILLEQELQQRAAGSRLRLGRWGGLVLVYCDQASPGHQPGSVWGEMGTWSRPLGTLAQAGTLAPVRGGGSGLHTTTPPPPPPPRHTAACI